MFDLPSEMIYFKRKEFAHPGSKFFPFSIDPFTEGTLYAERK